MPKGDNLKGKGFDANPQNINRNGRPRKKRFEELAEIALDEEKNGITAELAIIKALRNKAINGDVQAARLLWEYVYGKPTQQVEVTTDNFVISFGNDAESE